MHWRDLANCLVSNLCYHATMLPCTMYYVPCTVLPCCHVQCTWHNVTMFTVYHVPYGAECLVIGKQCTWYNVTGQQCRDLTDCLVSRPSSAARNLRENYDNAK